MKKEYCEHAATGGRDVSFKSHGMLRKYKRSNTTRYISQDSGKFTRAAVYGLRNSGVSPDFRIYLRSSTHLVHYSWPGMIIGKVFHFSAHIGLMVKRNVASHRHKHLKTGEPEKAKC